MTDSLGLLDYEFDDIVTGSLQGPVDFRASLWIWPTEQASGDPWLLKETEYQLKLLTELKLNVRTLINESVSSDKPVSFDSQFVKKIVFIIQVILKHGLKEWRNGNMVTLWTFIYGSVPRLDESLRPWYDKIVQDKPDLSHDPLFMYWLTKALQEHVLHHHIGLLLQPDIISAWYEPWALLQTEENTMIFLTLVNSLEVINFIVPVLQQPVAQQDDDEVHVVRKVKSKKGISKRKVAKIADPEPASRSHSNSTSNTTSPIESPVLPPIDEENSRLDELKKEEAANEQRLAQELERMRSEAQKAEQERAAAVAVTERLRREAAEKEMKLRQLEEMLHAERAPDAASDASEPHAPPNPDPPIVALETPDTQHNPEPVQVEQTLCISEETVELSQPISSDSPHPTRSSSVEQDDTDHLFAHESTIETPLPLNEGPADILGPVDVADLSHPNNVLADIAPQPHAIALEEHVDKLADSEAEINSLETHVDLAAAPQSTEPIVAAVSSVDHSSAANLAKLAIEEAAVAAAAFEKKLAERRLGAPIKQEVVPVPDVHSPESTIISPIDDKQQQIEEPPSELPSIPLLQPVDMDAAARKVAIEERLHKLRQIDEKLSGTAPSEEPQAADTGFPSPVPKEEQIVHEESELAANPDSSNMHPSASISVPSHEDLALQRRLQLEEDIKRMRKEQEDLQREAFEAETQRRILQAESEAKRLLEEARMRRIEQEEEELARIAAEEEAQRERERLAIEQEIERARAGSSTVSLAEKERLERLREEEEAEKARQRLQRELARLSELTGVSLDSPKRHSSLSSSGRSSPMQSFSVDNRSSSPAEPVSPPRELERKSSTSPSRELANVRGASPVEGDSGDMVEDPSAIISNENLSHSRFALADSTLSQAESHKKKDNFTLEEFLSGELDGLEEDDSTSSSKSAPTLIPDEVESPITNVWAPPKKRIYFNIQLKSTTDAQGNLCAGCGKTFSRGLFGTSARYCDYSGKYFCTSCHSKQTAIIPARVLRSWDFKFYQVSNFYKNMLDQMLLEPIYDVDAVAPSLYQISPKMKQLKVVRAMLTYMREYTATCRKKDQLMAVANKLLGNRPHLFSGSSYSMYDFVEAYKDKLLKPLIQLCKVWMNHILHCEVCKGKGSYCEFCKSNEVVYPFHLRYTIVCKECKAVSHRKCFRKGECPRCKRLKQRKADTAAHM